MSRVFVILAMGALALAIVGPAHADGGNFAPAFGSDVSAAPKDPAMSHHGLLSTEHRLMLSDSTVEVQQKWLAKVTTAQVGEIVPASPVSASVTGAPDMPVFTSQASGSPDTAQVMGQLQAAMSSGAVTRSGGARLSAPVLHYARTSQHVAQVQNTPGTSNAQARAQAKAQRLYMRTQAKVIRAYNRAQGKILLKAAQKATAAKAGFAQTYYVSGLPLPRALRHVTPGIVLPPIWQRKYAKH